jgi:hypothetical protein
MGQTITTETEQMIIERLKKLPPRQLDEVIRYIDNIAERERDGYLNNTDELRRSILALRGRGKGENLVKRLLQSRREDLRADDRD